MTRLGVALLRALAPPVAPEASWLRLLATFKALPMSDGGGLSAPPRNRSQRGPS